MAEIYEGKRVKISSLPVSGYYDSQNDSSLEDDKVILHDRVTDKLALAGAASLVTRINDAIAETNRAIEICKSINYSNKQNLHSDFIRTGRNIMEILDNKYHNVTTIERCFELLHIMGNNDHVNDNDTTYWKDMPDYSLLELGDYLELNDINDSDGNTYEKDEYSTTRINICGFNFYKGMGNTGSGSAMVVSPLSPAECRKNHILWSFDQCVCMKRMHSANTAVNHAVGAELKVYLDTVFYNALKDQIGEDNLGYIYHEYDTTWVKDMCWLPTVFNLYGSYRAWGTAGTMDTNTVNVTNARYPLYGLGFQYFVKRYKGKRTHYWTSTPFSTGYYCTPNGDGTDNYSPLQDGAGLPTLESGVSPCFVTW